MAAATTRTTTARTPKDPGHPYAQTKHISFAFWDQTSSTNPFGYEHFVSLPPAYSASSSEDERRRSWPLILFLHGAGESQRGRNESYASIRHGIPKVILCYDKLRSGVEPPRIDIPQAERIRKGRQQGGGGDLSPTPVSAEVCELVAENFITVTPSLNMDNGYGWSANVLSALLDQIVQKYRVDLDRIHVTGFSMGGYGTWDLGMHSPNRFATLVPICGGGDTIRASSIAHIPHWVHHGDLDDIISVKQSMAMVNALKKAGASEVKFTRYPDLQHDSWTAAYGNVELYRWMLQHSRKRKGDEIAVPPENKVTVA